MCGLLHDLELAAPLDHPMTVAASEGGGGSGAHDGGERDGGESEDGEKQFGGNEASVVIADDGPAGCEMKQILRTKTRVRQV